MRDKPATEQNEKSRTRAYMYRCRLCGALHSGLIGNFSYASGHLVLIGLEIKRSVYVPCVTIPRQSYHFCEDGGFGISDIQGFQNHEG